MIESGFGRDLEALRGEFPILAQRNYLNTCSLGALSLSSRRALDRFLALWDQKGARSWYEDWMDEVSRLEGLYARLIGAHPDEVAFHPSVTSALTTVAACLQHDRRPGVVLSELDFPTLAHQFLARRPLGARPEFVPSPDGIRVPAETLESRINETTGLLATLHVYFTTGYVQDLRRLTRHAHAQGALVLADGYHAVGSIPVDVHELGVDFYVGGSLKWLCGGPGAAFLYVRRDVQEGLRPTVTGWFSQRQQFDFGTDLDFAEGSRRFRTGTPPTGSVYAAAAGAEILLGVGADRVRRRQIELTQRLTDGALGRGFSLGSPPAAEERGGIVAVLLPEPEEMVVRLLRRGIIVDSRPGRIRISPHFYNTPDDCDQILEALTEEVARPDSPWGRPA